MAIVEDVKCSAQDVVGSAPGEWYVTCELPLNHPGFHQATYEWIEDINNPVEWPDDVPD